MLVGDVRLATTRSGCSWTLSGGSQWLPSSTCASKKPHVRRDRRRRNLRCPSESVARLRVRGRPSHHISKPEKAQHSRIGAARAQVAVVAPACHTAIATTPASAGANHIVRTTAGTLLPTVPSTTLEGLHCSRYRRDTRSRQS